MALPLLGPKPEYANSPFLWVDAAQGLGGPYPPGETPWYASFVGALTSWGETPTELCSTASNVPDNFDFFIDDFNLGAGATLLAKFQARARKVAHQKYCKQPDTPPVPPPPAPPMAGAVFTVLKANTSQVQQTLIKSLKLCTTNGKLVDKQVRNTVIFMVVMAVTLGQFLTVQGVLKQDSR